MGLLQLNNLSKHYTMGGQMVKALNGINLSIKKNDYVAIIGSSGSGKSTMMNILGCLDKPTEGEYLLKNKNVLTLNENQLADIRSQEIGFIFQSFNLLPKASAIQNVMLPLIYQKVPAAKRKEMAVSALNKVKLIDRMDHTPNQLSGGQRQRVAIARALVTSPSILLADEPTGNLDNSTTQEIMSLFDQLHNEGQTIIIVTHETDIAERCHRVIKLQDGFLVEDYLNKEKNCV